MNHLGRVEGGGGRLEGEGGGGRGGRVRGRGGNREGEDNGATMTTFFSWMLSSSNFSRSNCCMLREARMTFDPTE